MWDQVVRRAHGTNCERVTDMDVLTSSAQVRRRRFAVVAATFEYLRKEQTSNVVAQLWNLHPSVPYFIVVIGNRWP